MAYGDFKDLTRRTDSEKVLRDKPFNVAKNSKYDGYHRILASMVYNFFNKKILGSGITNEIKKLNKINSFQMTFKNQLLKTWKKEVYSSFKDNINLMLGTNEIRHIEWHETCKYKCRLNASVYNNKQWWNKDKCRYECKELIDKGICNKRFFLNPSNFDCECNESCDIGEYLFIYVILLQYT